jgi:hypothetical protein
MTSVHLRPLIGLLALLAFVATTGCTRGSSPGTSAAPTGVTQPIWNDYCRQNAAVIKTIQRALNGTLYAASLVPLFNGIEQAIDRDASAASNATVTSQFQALAAGIDSVKSAISTGAEPDYTQITSVLPNIPTCNK